jgi:3-oxoacyl-[acyl-carrier-protein] synthase-3
MKTALAGLGVAGVGWYVPGRRIDNETISRWCGATPEWVIARTGVHERRYAGAQEPTSAMAAGALQMALDDAGLNGSELAAVIVCTSTPDQPQPPTAAFVLARLGITGIGAFDVNGVCASFLYGIGAVGGWRSRGPVAVIGADKYSAIMNRQDRRTVSLFGDGAGAIILDPAAGDSGVISVVARCEPEYLDLVRVRGGGSALPLRDASDPLADRFEMDGRSILAWAESALPIAANQACDEAGLTLADIDRFVMHQANPKMLKRCAEWLGVPSGKMAISADRYGNTGAASVPLTLAIEVQEKRINKGDHVMLTGLGGGTAACVSVVKW